jgi:hypothetical protein
MGIDIYMEWEGQTEAEKKAQITGFSVTAGRVGYLREAYHGDPYATRALVPEAFFSHDGKAAIPARTMRDRLDTARAAVEVRERTIYKQTDAKAIAKVAKSFSDFVRLAERMEKKTGKPVVVVASY